MTSHQFPKQESQVPETDKWRVWVVGISENYPMRFKNLPALDELRPRFIEVIRAHFKFAADAYAEKAADNLSLRLAVSTPDGQLVTYYQLSDLNPRSRMAC